MRKLSSTEDHQGHPIAKGDTVGAIGGQTTGKITEIAREDDTIFVQLRPAFQPYAKGVWYPAEQVMWLSDGPQTKKQKKS